MGQAGQPFFPPKKGVVCVSKLSLKTLQPKKSYISPQPIVTSTAKPMLSLQMLHTLGPLSLLFYVIYALLCYVDVCQCVYVCVCCARIYRMCSRFCCGLAPPSPSPGCFVPPVMSRRARRMRKPACSLPPPPPLVSVSLLVPSFPS